MESITQKIKHIMSILGLLIMVSQANAQGQQKNMMDHKEKSQIDLGFGYEIGQRTSATALRANTSDMMLRFRF